MQFCLIVTNAVPNLFSFSSFAVIDGGFEAGETAEQLITPANSIFLFYDEDGKWVTSGQLSTTNVSTENKVSIAKLHLNIMDLLLSFFIISS